MSPTDPTRKPLRGVALALAMTLLAPPAGGFAQEFPLPGEQAPEAAGGDPVFEGCSIELVDELDIPAEEPGVLIHLSAKEGSLVRAEEVLARIDAREPEVQKRGAEYALRSAVTRANDDIEKLYAVAAADVARQELAGLLESNSQRPGAIAQSDIRKAELEVTRSDLAIKKAEHDRKVANLEAWTKKVEVDMAQLSIERRTIRSPFDGQVVEVARDQGEWVNPGDMILRMVRLDTLQVDGFLLLDKHSVPEVLGCEVTVEVTVAKRQTLKAPGRVVGVNPEVLRGNKAIVRAEIANRQEGGQWAIYPKMQARMTIHLGTNGATARAGAGG